MTSIPSAALIERLRNDTYHEGETSPNAGPCEPNERRAWNSAMRHVEMVIVPELVALTSTARSPILPTANAAEAGPAGGEAGAVSPLAPWPADQPPRFNGSSEPCDMRRGPCSCGAWHHDGDQPAITRAPAVEIEEGE